MRKIKTIAIKTMQLGFINESEKILRSLMIGQIEQMGTLHEETLDTIVLLGYNLALLQRAEDIQDLLTYLQETSNEISLPHKGLQLSIRELEELINRSLRIVS